MKTRSALRSICPPYQMASTHFTNLEQSIRELKRVYLDDALASGSPNTDHQELARAFLTLAHAELEFYVEEALRELAIQSFAGVCAGTFGRPSIALVAFSGLEPKNGGTALSTGKKKTPRQLAMRFGEAHAVLLQRLDRNTGVREKHIASMAIPLGLDSSSIDSTWLNDLDAFCTARGAFAHMSRTTSRGSHLAVNPHDVWTKCERLIWTNPTLATPGLLSSFESFDAWIEAEKLALGPQVIANSWRLRLSHFVLTLVSRLIKKLKLDEDNDE
ncbi:hypothetical protein GETHOR_22820 [Geothrix oryzae]|uniref:RiboL-PSP-HEPN domain-containing protein n=2 Tax=Geothrix oryzae TaxID=2927975 RepID=A0ABN6UZV3_9BACT|nr:hypothetical protein GETHOR_22820 [Geothrix oryzae]